MIYWEIGASKRKNLKQGNQGEGDNWSVRMTSIVIVDSIVLLINHSALTKGINNLVKSVQEVEVIFTKYYINSDSKRLVVFHLTSNWRSKEAEKNISVQILNPTKHLIKNCIYSQKDVIRMFVRCTVYEILINSGVDRTLFTYVV